MFCNDIFRQSKCKTCMVIISQTQKLAFAAINTGAHLKFVFVLSCKPRSETPRENGQVRTKIVLDLFHLLPNLSLSL